MRKRLELYPYGCILLICIALCACTRSEKIKLKGSDTVLPLSQEWADAFMKQHKDASISVVGGGSGVGISALLSSTTDLAQASRDIKTSEKLKLVNAGKEIVKAIVAYDALAVVVNPGNPVEQLTRQQLEKIFTGEYTNWKELGGNDLKIIVYSRESSSGTYEFFKEHVLNKKNFVNTALSMSATGTIIQSVSQTEGAIGYVGIAYVGDGKNAKALAVSYDDGKTYVLPSIETAKDKSYPVSRPLFYFYEKAKEPKIKAYLDYVLSDKGQETVLKVGYVPIR